MGIDDARLDDASDAGKLRGKGTYDCAFLEPLALPPDLPPPVILIMLEKV